MLDLKRTHLNLHVREDSSLFSTSFTHLIFAILYTHTSPDYQFFITPEKKRAHDFYSKKIKKFFGICGGEWIHKKWIYAYFGWQCFIMYPLKNGVKQKQKLNL